jgi:hypothetical protein
VSSAEYLLPPGSGSNGDDIWNGDGEDGLDVCDVMMIWCCW